MSLVGADDGTRRLSIPTQRLLLRATGFTMGAWCYFSSAPVASAIYSLVRGDGNFTAVQINSSGNVRSVFWNNSASVYPTTGLAVGSTVPLNTWVFIGGIMPPIPAGSLVTFMYVPGQGVVTDSVSTTGDGYTWGNPVADLTIGATESAIEPMRTGWGVAEVMFVRGALQTNQLASLAHAPRRFARRLALYLPLRANGANTEVVSNRSYPILYQSAARSAISATFHPPVERWGTRKYFFIGQPTTRTLRPVADLANSGWVASDSGTIFNAAATSGDAVRATTKILGAAVTLGLG